LATLFTWKPWVVSHFVIVVMSYCAGPYIWPNSTELSQ